MMSKTIFTLYLFLFCSTILFSQNQETIDSLQIVLKSDISDKKRVDIYNEIANLNQGNDSTQVMRYSSLAFELAENIQYLEGQTEALINLGTNNLNTGKYQSANDFFQDALIISSQVGYQEGKAKAYKNIGIIYDYQGDYQQALKYYQKSLDIALEIENETLIIAGYNNIGVIYYWEGDYISALENYSKSLQMSEKYDNKEGMIRGNVNVGIVYIKLKDYPIALEYLNKALKLGEQINDKTFLALTHENLGEAYRFQKDYDKAISHYEQALEILEELGDKLGIAYNLGGLGVIQNELNHPKEALPYFQRALKLSEEVGGKYEIAYNYNNIGIAYFKQELYDNAQSNLEKGLELGLAIENVEIIKDGSEYLAKVYEKQKNFEKAYETYILFKETNDSLFNEATNRELARIEARYIFEKREAILNAELKEKRATQLVIFLGLGFSIILIMVLAYFFVNQRKNNRKLNEANSGLKHYNKELQSANEIIFETSRKNQKINEELQTTLSLVKQQQEEIWDSISYAERIQQVILPLDQVIQETFSEHFIFYKPRDIVSGDFYWYGKSEMMPIFGEEQTTNGRQRIFKGFSSEKFIIAAVDCTGHGVPGAFMSLIGNNLLNAIINERKVYQVNEILNMLHQEIRSILKQEKTDNVDGMDISLVCVDFENQQLEFAGAKNPLIYMQEGKLHQVKGDIIGIGGGKGDDVQEVFTLNVIDISKSTTFYLFSDGYQDQFGGERGKKFMSKRFRELLFEIHEKPMEEQQVILEETLQNWMGKEEQVDDILVMGVRV